MSAEPMESTVYSNVHIGCWLGELRRARGLSVVEVARQTGLSRNTVMTMESEELPNPTLSTLFALMNAYGVDSLDDLFGPAPSRGALDAWLERGRPGLRGQGDG